MARSVTDVLRERVSLRDEMATGDLGDDRLNARRNQLMTVLEQSPDKGFPERRAAAMPTQKRSTDFFGIDASRCRRYWSRIGKRPVRAVARSARCW